MGNTNWTFIIVKIMISVLLVVIIKMKDENDMGWKSDLFSFCTSWRLGKAFCSLLQMGDSGGQSQVVQGRVYKLELPQCLGTPQLPNPRQLIQFKIKKKKKDGKCYASQRQMYLKRSLSFQPVALWIRTPSRYSILVPSSVMGIDSWNWLLLLRVIGMTQVSFSIEHRCIFWLAGRLVSRLAFWNWLLIDMMWSGKGTLFYLPITFLKWF